MPTTFILGGMMPHDPKLVKDLIIQKVADVLRCKPEEVDPRSIRVRCPEFVNCTLAMLPKEYEGMIIRYHHDGEAWLDYIIKVFEDACRR